MDTEQTIKQIEDDIVTVQIVIDYVSKNPYKWWCRGINIEKCEQRLKFYKAALKNVIFSFDDVPF